LRAVGDRPVRVVCTRKTTPGLRGLEKYAVRVGGGANHRFGLDDAVLIKDNHLALVGSAAEAVARARHGVGHMTKIEVELDANRLDEIDAVIAAGADAILFDNLSPGVLDEAVRQVGGRAITEASGGITAANAAAYADTGVDVLSLGWLTHSAPALDVAMEIVPDGAGRPRMPV
jgi:nicotinate-nucleotide pyrophosphorylase (carboxylating)